MELGRLGTVHAGARLLLTEIWGADGPGGTFSAPPLGMRFVFLGVCEPKISCSALVRCSEILVLPLF